MAQASNQVVVYVKPQVAYGTGATITQADLAFRAITCTFTQVGEGLIERADTANPFGLPAPPVQGARRWDIAITASVQPFSSYTDVDSNPASPLLKACADLSAVTYDTASAIAFQFPANLAAEVTPCTVEMHEIGGNRYRAIDCVGTVQLVMDSTGRLMGWTFALQGRWQDPITSTFTSASTTYGNAAADPLPLTFCGASLTSGLRRSNGVTEATINGLASATLVPACTVTERKDANQLALNCYAPSFVARSGEPDTFAFACDAGPESDAADGLRAWAEWKAQARGRDLTMTMNQGASGHRVDIVMDEVHYRTPAPKTDQAFRQYDLIAMNAQGETPSPVIIYMLAGS
jgi:hypothetical protein